MKYVIITNPHLAIVGGGAENEDEKIIFLDKNHPIVCTILDKKVAQYDYARCRIEIDEKAFLRIERELGLN